MLSDFTEEAQPYERVRTEVIQDFVDWLKKRHKNIPQNPANFLKIFGMEYMHKMTEAQGIVAAAAIESIRIELEAQKYPFSESDLHVNTEIIVGRDQNGESVLTPLTEVMENVDRHTIGTPEFAAAWEAGQAALVTKSMTLLSDTSRTVKSADMVNKGSYYVRVLTPPSCSRCIVLAGRKAQRPTMGFKRHPRCDCTQTPSYRGRGVSKKTDPDTAFSAMTEEEQNKVFGKAGAEAIRQGADIGQVVNSRRGMDDAGMTTTSGNRRGISRLYMRNVHEELLRTIPGAKPTPRLTPAAIYKRAGGDMKLSRELLYANGYLISEPLSTERAKAAADKLKQYLKEVQNV